MTQLRVLWMLPAILLLGGVVRVEALKVSGDVDTLKDTHFITRFVFEPSEKGVFHIKVKYPKFIDENMPELSNQTASETLSRQRKSLLDVDEMTNWKRPDLYNSGNPKPKMTKNDFYKIVIFNNAPGQWPFIRKNEDKLTCWEKHNIANKGGMIISLSTETGCKEITENGEKYVLCDFERTWQNYPHPRWWFITFQNCGTYREPGIQLTYEFTMTNGNNFFTREFSADEKITLLTNIVFLVFYTAMIILAFTYKVILNKKKMLHSTYQLHMWSVYLAFLGILLIVISQYNFAVTGMASLGWLGTIGLFFTLISSLVYLLDAILIAKGFTVTRGRISTSGSIKITLVMVAFAIANFGQLAWQYLFSDDRDVFNIYETPAAYLEIALRVFGFVWVCYAVATTVRHHPAKRQFYFYFIVFFVIWFAMKPLMIAITNNTIPSHARAQMVNIGYMCTIFFGHAAWFVLFFPNNFNKMFPYHMRANQVGVILIGDVENSSERYSADTDAVHELDNVATVACESETKSPRRPRNHSRMAGRPVPMINNFFEQTDIAKNESTQQAAAAPAPPVCFVPIPAQFPGQTTDYSMFLASSATMQPATTTLPAAAAPAASVSLLPPAPAATANPAVITAVQGPDIQTSNAAAATAAPKDSTTSAKKATKKAKCDLPVCKDFGLFMASSLKEASQMSTSQPEAETSQENTTPEPAAPANEAVAVVTKTEEFQPVSTSSSLSTVNLE